MKSIFDKYIETSFDGPSQAIFKFRQFEKNYRQYFPLNKASQVLDIGIGRGEMLECMRRWGYQENGIDISPSTVEFCKKLGYRCDTTMDTISWMNDHPCTFDLVTCLDVLEHVPRESIINFISALRGMLTEGGKAIIQVPNLQSPFGYLHHFNDITHVTGFVEHSLAQVLLAAGFQKFEFNGFEEICRLGLKSFVRRHLRTAYWNAIRALRVINTNPNPRILNPVFYAVAFK